jgi:peptidoglycan/xylan/chitin deacetylase (PgdA/CDA1 family)
MLIPLGDHTTAARSTDAGERLVESRRAFARDFCLAAGFDPDDLTTADLDQIAALLGRADEHRDPEFHNGHNWEPLFASANRQASVERPIVDELLLQRARIGANERPSVWPDGARFAVCLTHDMDVLSGNPWRQRLRGLKALARAPMGQATRHLMSTGKALARLALALSPADPPIEAWLDLESTYETRSSMLFLADPDPPYCWEDAFNRGSDPIAFRGARERLSEVMAQVSACGWDIGLHGSTWARDSAEKLAAEKANVEANSKSEVKSSRQHHLSYDVRTTPRNLVAAGLQVDSSLGSNLRPCYRAGTGLPFYHYDWPTGETLPLLDVPLVIQDIALFEVQGMTADVALSTCRRMLDDARRLGGLVTVLWHNNLFPDDPRFGVYEGLLRVAKDQGAWLCNLREVHEWWTAKARVKHV